MQHALPQRCALCAGAARNDVVCVHCCKSLPRVAAPCPRCALPRVAGDAAGSCARCRHEPPPWSQAVSAFAYAFPVDRAVHALKYRGAQALGGWFGAALASAVQVTSAAVDCVVPLPLAWTRQQQRGYNQAGVIAAAAARALGLPTRDALLRIRATQVQAELPWATRITNMRGAFLARSSLHGARIALVDDVMTTGATLRAATQALQDAGAADVAVWVAARTL